MQVDVALLPAQRALVEDTSHRYVYLRGGLGGGKSRGLIVKAFCLGVANPGCLGLFIEPTFRLVEQVAVRGFKEFLTEIGMVPNVHYRYHETKHLLTVYGENGFEILFLSGEDPDLIVSYNAAFALIDEPEQQPVEVFDNALRRFRHPKRKVTQVVLGGTPEKYDWAYEKFEHAPIEGSRVIRAKTKDNVYLPREYIESLIATMTPQQQRQYLDGEYVPRGSRVYCNFDRQQHVRACANKLEGQLVIGADFNVGKMVWVLGRKVQHEIHYFAEIISENTNTIAHASKAIDMLCELTGMFDRHRVAAMTKLIPDASGKQRRTSASESDIDYLYRVGFDVQAPRSNPFVRDRVFSVNLALHENRLFFSPECSESIKGIEQQGYDKWGDPDKSSGIDHACDAVGYPVHWFEPVAEPRGNFRIAA